MDQGRLVVFTKEINGHTGLDLCVLDDGATVADLVEALAPMSEDPALHKSHHPQHCGSCCGCKDNCCTTSLIVPDLKSISSLAAKRGLSLDDLTKQTCDPVAYDRGYIVLRSFPCLFLQNDRCTIYSDRPLICRLFICTPMTDPLQELIFRILGRGISELHRMLPSMRAVTPSEPLPELGGEREVEYRKEFARFYHRSLQQAALSPGEMESTYACKLRDLCDDDQWKVLTRS